ncbi:MAG: heme ABC exporter ATP-binding protein CcmA [Rhodomicrobiaceae bacterium]
MIKHPALQLIVQDLAAQRGSRMIFSGLDLTAPAGRALTVIGPNGAGKTTLLRCIAGLLPVSRGTVRLEGGESDHGVGEQCHYIGHLNGVKPALTVTENLIFFADFLAGDRGTLARATDRLALGGLEDVPAAYLSAGQKRRLGLARLLCAQRPVWLLDEPAVSLDAASQRVLADIVAEHLAGGGIVIAVTHTPLGWEEAATFEFSTFAPLPEAGLDADGAFEASAS